MIELHDALMRALPPRHRPRLGDPKGRADRRRIVRIWLLGLALIAASGVVNPARAESPVIAGLVPDGEVALHRTDTVVVDNQRRHLLAFHDDKANNPFPDAARDRGLVLSRFSGDGMVKDLERVVPGLFLPRGFTTFVPNAHAYDAERGLLHLLVYKSKSEGNARVNPMIATVDAALNVVAQRPFPVFPQGAIIQGLSYYAPTNSIYALASVTPDPVNLIGTYSVLLNEVDAATMQPRWAAPYVIPGCQKAVGGTRMQAAVARTESLGKVFVGCGTGNLLLSPQAGSPFVAAIDVRDSARLSMTAYPLAGSYSAGETLADPVNERFVMLAATPGTPVQAAWIFDQRHGVYVGVVNAGSRNIFAGAIDPDGGWLYVGVDDQLLIGSHLGLKIPQALEFPEPDLFETPVNLVPVRYARKVIVPTNHIVAGMSTIVMKVYRTTRPDYRPPPPADPDADTRDVRESDKTDVDFTGDAQAFGARAAQVGGIDSAAQNVAPSRIGPSYWQTLVSSNQVLRQSGLVLNDGDRTFDFARVTKAHLSQVEAAAKAISLDRDTNTAEDYATLTTKSGRDGKWPYSAAQCADFGDDKTDEPGDNADTTCDRAAGMVGASGVYDQSGPVGAQGSFGSATSNVTVKKIKQGGVETTSTATVYNLVLAPGVSIGKITSIATAKANGRKRGASASYTRTFENVQVGTFKCTTDCDPQLVVDRINAVPGLTFRAELPASDTVASPGGAQALVVRESWHHQQEVVLNHKDDTALHVPALRLVHYNDNFSISRTIYDFAGTSAASGYNISIRAKFGGSDLGGGFTDPPASGGLLMAPVDANNPSAPSITSPKGGGKDGGGLSGLLRRLGEGLRILLTGRPYTLLAIALWSLLLFPFFISSRRHLLVALVKGS